MIEFNGKSFSGSVIKNDDVELIVTIFAVETLQDLCIILTEVKTVTESVLNGEPAVYAVNNAVSITSSGKNVYTITFSKKLTVMEELSNAVDAVLVMLLEKRNV